MVWNTGVEGVVQHKFFDCCCFGCIMHFAPCSQGNYSDAWITASIKGKHDLNNINAEEWFKSIAKENTQNDILNFEQFDAKEEDNDECNKVVDVQKCDDADKIEDAGDYQAHEVFLENENDEPVVYLDNFAVNSNGQDGNVCDGVCNEVCDVMGDEISSREEDDILEVMVEDYVSSDCSEESEVEYEEDVIPLSLDEDDPSINFQWNQVVKEMRMYNSYSSFRGYVMHTTLPAPKLRLKLVMDTNDVIDPIAMHFYPKDGPKDFYPIKTKGDGNCLANALAHLLLGDKGRNDEVHVHAAFISVLRDNDFLDHDVLARTCPQGTQNRPHSYSHYSGMLTPEITQLNENAIRTVYQCDIMANRIDGCYMGIWQFHHISEAFK